MQFRLEKARTHAEVLEIRKEATALWRVAKLLKAKDQVVADCLRIVDRTEKLVGEKLIEQEKHKGGRPKKNLSEDTTGCRRQTNTYRTRHLRDQSAYFQKRARTDDAVIDRVFDQALEEGRSLLRKDITAAVRGATGQHRPRRRQRRRKDKRAPTLTDSELLEHYHLKETGGWTFAATNDFLRTIPWDHELVPEDYASGLTPTFGALG